MTDTPVFPPLRLLAEDQDDLAIISAAVQDAVGKVGGFEYLPLKRQFVLELNRFRWEILPKKPKQSDFVRVRSGLAINGVLGVHSKGVPQGDKEAVLEVLSLEFIPGATPPGGVLLIHFAGGSDLRLNVECLDVSLFDTDQNWSTPRRPRHQGVR